MDALIPFTTSGSLVDLVDSGCILQIPADDVKRGLTILREGDGDITRRSEVDRRFQELRPVRYVTLLNQSHILHLFCNDMQRCRSYPKHSYASH